MYKLELLWPDGSKTYRKAKTTKQAYRIVERILETSPNCYIRIFKEEKPIDIFVN